MTYVLEVVKKSGTPREYIKSHNETSCNRTQSISLAQTYQFDRVAQSAKRFLEAKWEIKLKVVPIYF